MHEVSLMQDTVIIATRQAREAGAQRIHRVAMKVGALSGAVPETLEFAFEIVAKGTMAEGATLDIERIPVMCFCPACAQEFDAGGSRLRVPALRPAQHRYPPRP